VDDSLPEPPDDSIVGTPDRRRGSVRRTANINMTWPAGFGTALRLSGRARDLLTTDDGVPVVLAEAEMTVGVGAERTIESISVVPERAGAARLVGAQGGGGLRSAIDAALPGEGEAGTPLYFLLDDIAGATLIAGFAWSQTRSLVRPKGQGASRGVRKGRIICSGLRPGGYYEEHLDSTVLPHFLRRAGDLAAEDPWGWHAIEAAPAICMRRRRRIDAWRDGPVIEVDAHFRDSLWDPDHVELAVHEYTFTATIDAASHTLLATDVVPLGEEPPTLQMPPRCGTLDSVSTTLLRIVLIT
jgi:hypothetical protein